MQSQYCSKNSKLLKENKKIQDFYLLSLIRKEKFLKVYLVKDKIDEKIFYLKIIKKKKL